MSGSAPIGRNIQDGFDPDFLPDDRLFHYTSSAGLYGILESHCLWATHFRFLNDSRELYSARASLEKYAVSKVRSEIEALQSGGQIQLGSDTGTNDLAEAEAKRIVDIFYNVAFGSDSHGISDAFVFSTYCCDMNAGKKFTDGTLYHWATYGKSGGFAIQINPHKLGLLLQEEKAQFGGMQYFFRKAAYAEGDDIPEGLEADYEHVGQAAQAMTRHVLVADAPEPNLSAAGVAFFKIATALKDKCFSDEFEARVVMLRPLDISGRHDMKFRSAGALSIPYIKLFEDRLLGERNPIEGIIIGPHQDNSRRKTALKMFLKERGLEHIAVTESAIPYVTIAAS